MKSYKLTSHAKEEMTRRQIPLELLEKTMLNPQQVINFSKDRQCFQSVFAFPSGKSYLIRVVTENINSDLLIVTVYRTSKIKKYVKEEK